MKKVLRSHQILAGHMINILESPTRHPLLAAFSHQHQLFQHHQQHRQMTIVPLSSQGPAANQRWKMLSTTIAVLGTKLQVTNEVLSPYPVLEILRHQVASAIPQSPPSSKIKPKTPLLEVVFRQSLDWKTTRRHTYSSRLPMLKRGGVSCTQCYLERRRYSSKWVPGSAANS